MMQKSTDRKFIDMDQRNNPLMTLKTVKYYCDKQSLPQKSQQVDILYLQFKGFQKIISQTFSAFINVHTLHLNNNGIKKIEGLFNLKGLINLYLNNNFIEKIQGLDELPNLQMLNLAHNKLDIVQNLDRVISLRRLNLSQNFLSNSKDIEHLLTIQNLSQLNLSQNDLEPIQQIIKVITNLKNLTHLFLKSTSSSSNLKNYRKRLISKLKNLIFLDNQPVFPADHLLAEAWQEGGQEKQAQVKSQITKQRIEKQKHQFDEGLKRGEQKLKQQTSKVNNLNNIVYQNSQKGPDNSGLNCAYIPKQKGNLQKIFECSSSLCSNTSLTNKNKKV